MKLSNVECLPETFFLYILDRKSKNHRKKQIKTNQNKSKQIKTNQNKSKQIKTIQGFIHHNDDFFVDSEVVTHCLVYTKPLPIIKQLHNIKYRDSMPVNMQRTALYRIENGCIYESVK